MIWATAKIDFVTRLGSSTIASGGPACSLLSFCVSAELFLCRTELGGEVSLQMATTRDSRDYLCDALAKCRWGFGQRTPIKVFGVAIKIASD